MIKSCVMSAVLLAASFAQQSQPVSASEYPTATIRESHEIILNGLKEVWRLEWTSAPKPACELADTSFVCPCEGFAYGESGDLFLVRSRGGQEVDRLQVTPFFEDLPGGAIVQKWAPDDKDFEASQRADFETMVGKRPTVQLMRFADYDHDGVASEFYLQTEALPCGKSAGIVIGISRDNPSIHVFGTATNPNKPLVLQKREWEAVRDASGSVEIKDWDCDDHGAEMKTTLLLRWTSKGISGSRREYTCPDHLLIQEDPLQ
jgi:hypothetical protein